MKIVIFLTLLICSYLFYGLYVSQHRIEVVPSSLRGENPSGWYDYRGVTNVRSNLSSGSSNPSEIIASAKKSNLDFLVLTDSNQFESSSSSSGYYGSLLVLDESEYSFLDSRLIYYSGQDQKQPQSLQESALFFTDLLSQKEIEKRDSIVVLAQPFKGENSTWSGEYPAGLDGIEVINPKSISEQAWKKSKFNVLVSLLTYPFSPNLAFLRLFNEPKNELALWDSVASTRPFLGFAGSDASARAFPLTDYLMKFPSYQKSFEFVSNHLLIQTELTGNFSKDRIKILRALKKGQFYLALDLLGDPRGFWVSITDTESEYPMGSTIKYKQGLLLNAKIPWEISDQFEIVVIKNGEREFTSNSSSLEYKITGPGVYRVIVRVSPFLSFLEGKRWITWIYSNPFYVR